MLIETYLNIKHVTSKDHKFRIQSSNANSSYASVNLTLASISEKGAELGSECANAIDASA